MSGKPGFSVMPRAATVKRRVVLDDGDEHLMPSMRVVTAITLQPLQEL